MAIKRVLDLVEATITDNLINNKDLFELTLYQSGSGTYVSLKISYDVLMTSIKESLKTWLETLIHTVKSNINTGLPIGSIFYSALSYSDLSSTILSNDELIGTFAPCNGKSIRASGAGGSSDYTLNVDKFSSLTTSISNSTKKNIIFKDTDYESLSKLYVNTSSGSTIVYLPKLNNIYIQNTKSSDHKEIDAILPKITGKINDVLAYSTSSNKAFKKTESGSAYIYECRGSIHPIYDISFDSSRSNDVYSGSSDLIRPHSISLMPYVVIAQTSQEIVTNLSFGDNPNG